MDPISILKWTEYEYFSTALTLEVANTRSWWDSRSLSTPFLHHSAERATRRTLESVATPCLLLLPIDAKVSEDEQPFGFSVQVPWYKPEGKRPVGRPRRRWEDNIKMDLEEVGRGCGDWMELA